MSRTVASVTALLLLVLVGAGAQAPRQFRARLSPVPIDVAMQATIAGSGTVTAALSGTTLTLTGTFADLKSPATTARLHRSPARGMRGPVMADLTVSKGSSGSLSGSVELTAEQLSELTSGRLYVQLQSEKAPDGNLWGWLLVQEGKK